MKSEYELTINDYLAIIKDRALLLGLSGVLILAASVAVAISIPPVYESSGTILVESQQISPDLIAANNNSYADERIEVIRQRVMTRENLLRIIDKYNLFTQQVNNGPITQVGNRRSRGMEASLALSLPRNFAINANGTILDADGDLDLGNQNTPAGVPEKAANLELSWSGIDRLQLRGDLRYVGRRFTDDDNQFRVSAYTVVDLSATYAITKNVGVDARLYNLFDRAYAEGLYFDQQWILGRPRSFDVAVRAAF